MIVRGHVAALIHILADHVTSKPKNVLVIFQPHLQELANKPPKTELSFLDTMTANRNETAAQ